MGTILWDDSLSVLVILRCIFSVSHIFSFGKSRFVLITLLQFVLLCIFIESIVLKGVVNQVVYHVFGHNDILVVVLIVVGDVSCINGGIDGGSGGVDGGHKP